ncbi:MAG: sigma-70 family RNA polymerase sigma factor [Saprospiraceae bacterium]|nr:sigma-70 family RNA polymerase sigma factor [Saprospiraceae bacterium]
MKLLSENQGIIYKICNVYADSREDRDDLKQEVILQLWKSYPGFNGKSKFSTWMYRIAFNTAITNIRKSKKHPIVQALSGAELHVSEKEDIDYLNDDINRLYKAIAKLKDVERAIIMLYLEEKSYKEIGQITGVSEKNVSVKLVRLKEKLKKLMSKQSSHV